LGVVDRVGDEPVPIVGDAEPLGSIAPGFQGDLHEPNRVGRRSVALIEAALRARDRVDHAAIKLRTDRTVKRHTISGKAYWSMAMPRARAVLPNLTAALFGHHCSAP
jgi:hypothetical protein